MTAPATDPYVGFRAWLADVTPRLQRAMLSRLVTEVTGIPPRERDDHDVHAVVTDEMLSRAVLHPLGDRARCREWAS